MSDINKDGQLELDEFIIAMHLINLFKSGVTLPSVLPEDMIPAKFRKVNLTRSDSTASTGSRGRSGSVSNDDPLGNAYSLFFLRYFLLLFLKKYT